MAEPEEIKYELEENIRAARIGMNNARALFVSTLEGKHQINDHHLAILISAQTENTIADWTAEVLNAEGNTPAEALAEVRRRATEAVFKGARNDEPLAKALNEYRKVVYKEFLAYTQHLAEEEGVPEKRANNKYTFSIAIESVRRRHEIAMRAGHPALISAHTETLFTLTTGYERSEVTDEVYTKFVKELTDATMQKLGGEAGSWPLYKPEGGE